jgi:hypothetical protein
LENRCTCEKSGRAKKVNERPKGFVGENLSASEWGEVNRAADSQEEIERKAKIFDGSQVK